MKKVVCLLLVLSFFSDIFGWEHKQLSVKDDFGDEIRKDDYYIFGEDNNAYTDKFIAFFNDISSFKFGTIHFGGKGHKEPQNSVICTVKIKCDDGKVEDFLTTGVIDSNKSYWGCFVSLDNIDVNQIADLFAKNQEPKLVVKYGDESYNFGVVDCGDFTLNQDCIRNCHNFNSSFVCENCGLSLFLNMVKVDGGSFKLGDGSDSSVNVTLSDFYICDHEVTQAEYKAVMGVNPSRLFNGDNLPVEGVTWYNAVEYCNKLSELKGLYKCYSGSGNSIVCDWSANGYRLPTEAEWEYAARGGKKSKGYKYSGSNTIGVVAWYSGNSSDRTHGVKTKSANELGLYDMSGNVWEWCWDWYSSYSGGSNPVGAVSGSHRVQRGGGWNNASRCEVSGRYLNDPGVSVFNLGFRVVRSCPIGLI